ncbi:hypothetical protein [Streptomyces sp. MN13]
MISATDPADTDAWNAYLGEPHLQTGLGSADDQLAFIFDGGTLDEEQADRLRPRDDELSEAAFVTATEAAGRLRDRVRRRFEHALKALDTGRPV